MTSPRSECAYCGLSFSGPGYSPNNERRFCCCGCYLAERLLGAQGGEGIAAWLLVRLGIGTFLAMYVMMMSLILYTDSAGELGAASIRGFRWGLLVLSTPAVIILGAPFVIGGVRDLRVRKLSTDALIVTGSMAAYTVSTAHVIRGSGHIYYDTATMLLLIVTLGRLLESSAKNRTSKALREMMELIPAKARVLRDGQEVEIDSAQVRKNDLLVVRPGERIPADGRIVSGECLVEQATFTGEPHPRSCSPGDIVFGGSVNCDGFITVEATAVGAESLLAQIRAMVRRAQLERAPVERLAGRTASVFVPLVWLLSVGAALYWGAVRHDVERAGLSALAVLVVACPCALGIATPLAICMAIGKAARAGILIRSGEVLERLPSITRVFFDKTGTLTFNSLTVTGVRTVTCGVGPDEALAWAATLETGSEHGIARAISAAAREQRIKLGEVMCFKAHPGRGVEGVIALSGVTRRVTVGSLKLLSEEHRVPELLSLEGDGELSSTYIGWDGEVRAAVSLCATPRPEAADTVRALTNLGLKIAVISGDMEGPTKRLAHDLGISEVFAGCSPLEKAEIIRKTRATGSSGIAMLGDGINDAPALAQADVGIAVGGGADLARQSSDVTLLGDDLSRVPEVLELSRATYRTICQNLWWAFGYNSVAISLAFMGFVHPLIAAAAMVASSLSIIVNSMRLMR